LNLVYKTFIDGGLWGLVIFLTVVLFYARKDAGDREEGE
jgi:hypothetical protein